MFKYTKINLLLIILIILIFTPSILAANNQTDIVEIDDTMSSSNIYVNGSNNNPGNGSIDNPYKNIETIDIEKNTIIHLTDGEYTYKSFRSLNNVTFIGHNMNDTIIKCNNLEITSNNLILKNLTLIGVTFKNQGDLTADNVIFKNARGHDLDEYGNSYGGSIYTSYRQDDEDIHIISLTNCYFLNNTAEYGGVIYIDKGNMEIKNCYFINNHAFNYGGAICSAGAGKITIKKSKFINDYSINDCGAAIYIMSSSLTADDVEIRNCSSTFGPAITGLNAKLDINNLLAINNKAKYEGGAIYQMYGTSLITASKFINNSAKNGGALFLDNITTLMLISNNFTKNTAEICAGAIYSIANTEYQNAGNVYQNNHALLNNDVFNITTINPIIKDSNYTSFKYIPQGNITLPVYYNLVDDGYVTPIKDQQDSGNCWSFAVLAALESCILKATNITYDLSEENMKNLMASFSDYGWQIDVNEGGYDDMGVGYLVGWLGPVSESDDKFDDKSTLSPLLNSLLHIQNVVYLKRDNYLDNNAIKEAILKYGAVATGIYYSGLYLLDDSYYYYDTIMPSNHAVTIVGWDDNYSKYNFNRVPAGNGAFIVKNSWGTDWGDKGYFYVSYYDTKFAQIGKEEVSYTFILNDSIKYDKNYQYDISGKTDYLITGDKILWYENIFNATDDEYLAAVSTYFNTQTEWNFSVYVNDVFKLTKSGKSQAGYYTFTLGDLIHIVPGDVFKVVFKITCQEHANIPIVESKYINKVPFSNGVSYFSKDGENWIDLFNYTFSDFNHRYTSQIACIKAFTIHNTLNSTLTLDTSDKGIMSSNIKAIVCDQYGNPLNTGKVVFAIDGVDFTVDVMNGIANLTHIFSKASNYISAVFYSENYNSSHDNVTIHFSKPELKVNISNIQYGDYLIANVTLIDSENNLLSDDVCFNVNNQSYNVHVNGKGLFTIPISLSIGQYNITVECGDLLNQTILINVSKVNVDFTVDFDEKRDNVTVNVIFSKSVNETLIMSVNDENYLLNITDGKAYLVLNDLDYGVFNVNVNFTNENYNMIYKNYTFKRNYYKSQISFIKLEYLDNALFYRINLSKLNNNPIKNITVYLTVNNNTYNNSTDLNGDVEFKLNLYNGIYQIKIIFEGYEDIVGCIFNDELLVNQTQVVISNVTYSNQIKRFSDENLSITFCNKSHGNLTIIIDDNLYYNDYFNNNQFNISLSNLTIGNHKINIQYQGIEGYYYSKLFNISVIKANSNINLSYENLYVSKKAKLIFNLSQNATGYLFIKVNGKNYYSQINNGKAIFQIDNLILGANSLNYVYDGDKNYASFNGNYTLNVGYSSSITNNKDLIMNYDDGSYYQLRVLDAEGNILTNGTVIIRIDGNSYNVDIDKTGWVLFKINLKPNTYTIVAEHDGVKVSNKIIVKSILKLNTFKIKKSAKKAIIKASLVKINGYYLKNKKITFKFEGKKYVAKTNNKAIAKITIKKNILKKLKINKKYTIQINYLKDTIKQNIMVKK